MQVTTVYLLALCGCIAVTILGLVLRRTVALALLLPRARVFNNWFVNSGPRTLSMSWGRICFLLALLAVNGLLMAYQTTDLLSLSMRCAILAAINFLPLSLGGRTNVLVDFAGVSLPQHYFLHIWLGSITLVQTLIHSSIMLHQSGLKGNPTSGLVVSHFPPQRRPR
jgi:hypothetical protein